jgi:hypothetical protein
MEKKMVIKLAKIITRTILSSSEGLEIDDDLSTDTDTIPSDRKFEGGVIKPLDEGSIRGKLSSDVLSMELLNRFPELFYVRESVILRSHCFNHSVYYDSQTPFEDIPVNEEVSLVMASSIKLEDIDHFKSIIFGLRNKRVNVSKGERRVKDDPYRDKFLLLLTQCWSLSGAELREQKIVESKMSEPMVNNSIHEMEHVISDILSEFIFLRYKECNFGKILFMISITEFGLTNPCFKQTNLLKKLKNLKIVITARILMKIVQRTEKKIYVTYVNLPIMKVGW